MNKKCIYCGTKLDIWEGRECYICNHHMCRSCFEDHKCHYTTLQGNAFEICVHCQVELDTSFSEQVDELIDTYAQLLWEEEYLLRNVNKEVNGGNTIE